MLAFLDMPMLNSAQFGEDMLFLASQLDRQGILYLLWVQSKGYDLQPLLDQYKRTWRNIRDVHPWMCKALKNLMDNIRDDGQPLCEPYETEQDVEEPYLAEGEDLDADAAAAEEGPYLAEGEGSYFAEDEDAAAAEGQEAYDDEHGEEPYLAEGDAAAEEEELEEVHVEAVEQVEGEPEQEELEEVEVEDFGTREEALAMAPWHQASPVLGLSPTPSSSVSRPRARSKAGAGGKRAGASLLQPAAKKKKKKSPAPPREPPAPHLLATAAVTTSTRSRRPTGAAACSAGPKRTGAAACSPKKEATVEQAAESASPKDTGSSSGLGLAALWPGCPPEYKTSGAESKKLKAMIGEWDCGSGTTAVASFPENATITQNVVLSIQFSSPKGALENMDNYQVFLLSESSSDPKATLLVCMGRDGAEPPFAYLPNKLLVSNKGNFKDGIETILWERWEQGSKYIAPWEWNRL